MEELVLRGKSVLEALERGFKVKKASWSSSCYIYLKDGKIYDDTDSVYNERDTSLNEIYNRNWYYHTDSFDKVITHLYNGGAVCWLKYPDAMYVLDKSKISIRNIKTNALYGAGELFKAWFEVGGLICL